MEEKELKKCNDLFNGKFPEAAVKFADIICSKKESKISREDAIQMLRVAEKVLREEIAISEEEKDIIVSASRKCIDRLDNLNKKTLIKSDFY